MTDLPIEGGCYCGQVRYRATAGPIHQTLCHCESCRRLTGAPVTAWATFPVDGFEWTGPSPTNYSSSPPVVRTFCPLCGTSLTYATQDRHEDIDVLSATLDRPQEVPPSKEFFLPEKLPWMPPLLDRR
jgi:hypothetical protein